ncbi:MAG: aminotransferase class III-fold pyridoxal phosphate-dependent enzyme [Desulfobacterales bacterium]|nr:aminotransferase class III-fold pyridoxal phosphate-dependent enzyme [Desulfobacterales bacterium]
MDMLKKHYGIENAVLKKLEGYDSINYQVSTYKGQQYVWKQYRYTPETYTLLKAENRLLLELSSQLSFSFPVPLKGLNGKFIYCSDEKQLHRLLTYVKGKFLAEVEHTPELFVSFGHFLACMNKKILNFRNAEIEARQLHWDIQHLPLNRKFFKYILEPGKKKLIDYFFLQFRETVVPKIYDLRKSIIHSDANDWNVIVNNGKVTGIIDFGDIVYSPLVNEIAIAITYAILSKPDPVKWAGYIIKGYHNILPLEPEELNLLYYLIGARLCISVCNSAKAKQKNPDSEYIIISEKPAWNMLEKWISLNPIQAGADFSKAAGLTVTNYSDLNADLAKRQKYISKGVSTSCPHPVKMVKAAFQYMYDSTGKTYLDAYNNIPHVGHCHPKVVEAGQKQMACLNTNTRYLYDQLNYYAERLAGKFPDPLNKIYFVNSGSAACDLAIRLALTHTGLKDIMVVEHGYHGNTHTGIEISSYKFESKGGPGQASHIIKAPIPDIFRGKYQGSNAGEEFAQEAVNLLRQRSGKTAAFICEPIIGCGGQIPLPEGYLKTLYPAIRENRGVCISDEVQTGFGRLGKWFWGFRMQDVVPDIVVLGKPMGNGHPIAAVVTTDEISRSFENGMEFFSSFGGNSVSCAIGLAVLDVIEEEGLQQHALETGSYLKKRLGELNQKYSVIGDVRGQGLFLGIEFVKDTETLEPDTSFAGFVKNRLKENGILTGTDGPYDNVLKIKPPICFNKNNADQLVSEIEKILE